jgi:hypothetical protein
VQNGPTVQESSCRVRFSLSPPLPGDDRAGQRRLAGHFAVYDGFALHAPGAWPEREYFDLQPELVARRDGTPEFGQFDAGEDHQLIFAVRNFLQQQDAAGLGHRLHHQHAGHDRIAGEVAVEERFVDGDVLDGHDPLGALELDDAVDQQKRIAVGQKFHDLPNVQCLIFRRHSRLRWRNCCALRRKSEL